MINVDHRISEDSSSLENDKYNACVQRQNEPKYGQMTIARLCKSNFLHRDVVISYNLYSIK